MFKCLSMLNQGYTEDSGAQVFMMFCMAFMRSGVDGVMEIVAQIPYQVCHCALHGLIYVSLEFLGNLKIGGINCEVDNYFLPALTTQAGFFIHSHML